VATHLNNLYFAGIRVTIKNYFAVVYETQDGWRRNVNKMFRKIMKVESKGKIISMQMNYREEI